MSKLALPVPNRWRNFYHFAELDSTNEEAIRFIGRGVTSGVVAADRQTAGRGRAGKLWHSPTGNLYISFFERTTPERALDMAKIAGLAAFDAAAAFTDPARLRLKWPNDLLADGKKLCGVLIQHLTRGKDLFTVTGIGINIETPDKAAFPWRWEPTSLEEVTGTSITRGAAFRELAAALAEWIESSPEAVDAAYAGRVSWMLNARVSWTAGEQELDGTISRFSDRGSRLVVRTATGNEEELAAGDITSIMISQP